MGKLYPRLAMRNLVKNKQFYLPYLLTVIGTSAAFYIVMALASARDLPLMTRFTYLSMFMTIGTAVIALFSIIFLSYTNSFLMKRRKKELGLYNVLGLGKRHIGRMLGFETLYTAVAGIGGGILLGLLLQKLVTLLLYQIMHFSAYYGFYVSWTGIRYTVVLFGAILLLNLALNLLRIHVQNPMELLREGSTGEREPKSRWLLAVLGVLCLGSGYWIAVTTKSAMTALSLYFIAVFLVIIGTYCLFTAVSIVWLKALRRNKRYYYQTNHFIGVSGMLYRMKRNAVGLANICILSTMVLVMVSGTLALYLGSQNSLERQFPGNVAVSVLYDPTEETPFSSEAMGTILQAALEEKTDTAEPVFSYRELSLYAKITETGYVLYPSYVSGAVSLHFLTQAEYERAVDDGKLAEAAPLALQMEGGTTLTVTAQAVSGRQPATDCAYFDSLESKWYVLGSEDLQLLDDAQRSAFGDQAANWNWHGYWNASASDETLLNLPQTLEQGGDWSNQTIGTWKQLEVNTLENYGQDYYSLNGGFFFLGLFLGLLFILATVLIIYYKQVSEGYEDRERYLIMQKVGMEQQTVRRSVGSQILVVFFAPLLVAGIHVAFDYGLMTRLLTLLSVRSTLLTLCCTAGTFTIFCLIYGLVYWATARAYYRIVRA
ncbi:MAG: FtsX-like permease family protein [Oscillospiraceae bacterium]|nr:FtsX-like permease family protein [Oscillospiraceae bacterium]